MSPKSLDNPPMRNFVIAYRIRQHDKKYASCIRIHAFDVGKGEWDNVWTGYILIPLY